MASNVCMYRGGTRTNTEEVVCRRLDPLQTAMAHVDVDAHGWPHVILLCSAFLHALLFWTTRRIAKKACTSYAKLPDEPERRNWDSRVVSTVHAAFAVWASIWLYRNEGHRVFGKLGMIEADDEIFRYHNATSQALMATSLGYFCYDLVVLYTYYPRLGGMDFLCHHITAIFCLVLSLATKKGHFIVLTAIASEMSTPYVNLRYFLHQSGAKETKAYLLNGILLWTVWLVSRIYMFGSVSLFMFYNYRALLKEFTPAVAYLVLIAVAILNGLSLNWFWKITRGLVKALLHLRTGKRSKQL